MRRVSLAASVLLAASSLALAAPAPASTSHLGHQDCPVLTIDPDTVDFYGPSTTLWPPDHRLVSFRVVAREQEGGSSQVMLTVTPHVVESGRTAPGAVVMTPRSGSSSGAGMASVGIQLRAERNGGGSGRQYVIDWSVSFDNGIHPCSSSDGNKSSDGKVHHAFVVTVPHDMGRRDR
jgi:hypothetical protein